MKKITIDLYIDGTLSHLCNWLCGKQKDGKFGAPYFVEARAVRALLAGYKILNNKKYLEAAMAWAEAMMSEQREDGGYRMGYGVWENGQESCYVADGGETCTGMIALYSYAEGDFKKRLRKSVDNYMKHRESFRDKDGGIGIGWIKEDLFSSPPVQKEKVFCETRHLPFTIGCTLAAASAYSAITKEPGDIERAIKDTRRLMKEVEKMVGAAYTESLCWAHHYIENEVLRTEIESYMKEKWIPNITDNERMWWLEGHGRTVLGLYGLCYYYESVEQNPQVLETIKRVTTTLCIPNPPYDLFRQPNLLDLMRQSFLTGDEMRYLCFAAVSLAEVVQPNVSLRKL